jgi:hypothetical protein
MEVRQLLNRLQAVEEELEKRKKLDMEIRAACLAINAAIEQFYKIGKHKPMENGIAERYSQL